jgi:hypothetical protein
MRALVVFEPMFGNTKTIADAVAAGLASKIDVDTVSVARAPIRIPDDVELVVAGGGDRTLLEPANRPHRGKASRFGSGDAGQRSSSSGVIEREELGAAPLRLQTARRWSNSAVARASAA